MGLLYKVDNPFDFFEKFINIGLSKDFAIKLTAIATSKYFYLHFVFFPLILTGLLRSYKVVLGSITSLIIMVLGVGIHVSMFPLYVVADLFHGYTGSLMRWFKMMYSEFINLAVSLSVFGLFFGFVFSYFIKAMSFAVSWQDHEGFTIFDPIPKFKWSFWKPESIEPLDLLFNSAVFWIMSFFLGRMVETATNLADTLSGTKSSLGFNMKTANALTGGVFNGITSLGEAILAIPSQINKNEKRRK